MLAFINIQTYLHFRVGGFSEEGAGTPEDLIFFFQHLRLGGRVLRCDEELLMYRYHPQATTFSINELVARGWTEYFKEFTNVINQEKGIVRCIGIGEGRGRVYEQSQRQFWLRFWYRSCWCLFPPLQMKVASSPCGCPLLMSYFLNELQLGSKVSFTGLVVEVAQARWATFLTDLCSS